MANERKRLIKKLDDLARQYIRLRDGMKCQMCGRTVTRKNAHCSHVIPKSFGNRLRWHPTNLKLLCYHCHINIWHKSPVDAGNWFLKTFPERWVYLQTEKAKGVKKFSITELEELRDWYIRAIENFPETEDFTEII